MLTHELSRLSPTPTLSEVAVALDVDRASILEYCAQERVPVRESRITREAVATIDAALSFDRAYDAYYERGMK